MHPLMVVLVVSLVLDLSQLFEIGLTPLVVSVWYVWLEVLVQVDMVLVGLLYSMAFLFHESVH